MKYVFKIIGCTLLGFLCVAVPVLTAFSLVYQWGTFLSTCVAAEVFEDIADNRLDIWLSELLSVTPTRKTGHWILQDVEINRIWHCKCSECGKDPQAFIGGSENWWLLKNNPLKFCLIVEQKWKVRTRNESQIKCIA